MSAIIRQKRKGTLPVSTTVLWLVLGLAIVFFLVRYGQEVLLANELNARAAAQRQANAALRDENTRLRAMLQYYGSDKYIEQRAREDLNLRRPDEEVLIPVIAQGGAASHAETAIPDMDGGATQSAPPGPEPANWQKWLALFDLAP